MPTPNLTPRAANEGSLGTSAVPWLNGYFATLSPGVVSSKTLGNGSEPVFKLSPTGLDLVSSPGIPATITIDGVDVGGRPSDIDAGAVTWSATAGVAGSVTIAWPGETGTYTWVQILRIENSVTSVVFETTTPVNSNSLIVKNLEPTSVTSSYTLRLARQAQSGFYSANLATKTSLTVSALALMDVAVTTFEGTNGTQLLVSYSNNTAAAFAKYLILYIQGWDTVKVVDTQVVWVDLRSETTGLYPQSGTRYVEIPFPLPPAGSVKVWVQSWLSDTLISGVSAATDLSLAGTDGTSIFNSTKTYLDNAELQITNNGINITPDAGTAAYIKTGNLTGLTVPGAGLAGFWLGKDSLSEIGLVIGDEDQYFRYHTTDGLSIKTGATTLATEAGVVLDKTGVVVGAGNVGVATKGYAKIKPNTWDVQISSIFHPAGGGGVAKNEARMLSTDGFGAVIALNTLEQEARLVSAVTPYDVEGWESGLVDTYTSGIDFVGMRSLENATPDYRTSVATSRAIGLKYVDITTPGAPVMKAAAITVDDANGLMLVSSKRTGASPVDYANDWKTVLGHDNYWLTGLTIPTSFSMAGLNIDTLIAAISDVNVKELAKVVGQIALCLRVQH